jgi:hypothetical protein
MWPGLRASPDVCNLYTNKTLQNEMRTARLQTQDLGRAGQFVSTLLSKDDIKDMEKEALEAPKPQLVNGNSMSFIRADSKTRFSDPPAPPPQQPLPEKPDVPSLKRGTTERPKANAPSTNVSPIRQDGNVSQILQLTEALTNAKKELESQTTRMRDLEEKLNKERQARELAEELARRLEEAASTKMNGAAVKSEAGEEPTLVLEEAFEPPADSPTSAAASTSSLPDAEPVAPRVDAIEASASQLHTQLETMVLEMKDLKEQLEMYKSRAEAAEAERDADRKTLAEMALKIRKDAEAREAAARAKSRSRSSSRTVESTETVSEISEDSSSMVRTPSTELSRGQTTPDGSPDAPTLSRANTITPYNQSSHFKHDQLLANSLPYASMLGVVLLGMGLMAYINGWQPNPERLDR